MNAKRFLAEWIISEEDDPEPDPANAVYGKQSFRTKRLAFEGAQALAAKGPQPDWWRVAEQEYDADYYEPGIGDWADVRVWIEGVLQS